MQLHDPTGTHDGLPAEMQQLITKLEANMSSVVLGKPEVVRMCLVTLLAGEHLLLEDVPGVGKTLAGKALAKSLAGDFCRIQFTPDLLPSDIVGSNIYESQKAEFTFCQGPIFSNIVLADEINRAPPRTQSALLEAMSDEQVSVDGKTYKLPSPFMVIATQNPFEYEGTYALPESQLDRFLLRMSVGYPNRAHEMQVLSSHRLGQPVDSLQPAINCQQVVHLQEAVREVAVEDSVSEYLLNVVDATRHSSELHVGASTRGALSLYRAAQASAMISGRAYVVPDDVKQLAVPVLSHRVIPKSFVQGSQRQAVEAIVRHLVDSISVPG